jgi:hypothetical protein
MIARFVLIKAGRHNVAMGAMFILLFVLAVGPLALVYGADSRRWDERGGWPRGQRKS